VLFAGANLSYSYVPSCTTTSPTSAYADISQSIKISGQGFHEGELVSCSFNYSGSIQNHSIAQVLSYTLSFNVLTYLQM
jgi:hypothetical protein